MTELCCLGVKHLGSCDSTCEGPCCLPVADLRVELDDDPMPDEEWEPFWKAITDGDAR